MISKETGEGYTERYVAQLAVRIFSICKDFPERQGRDTRRDMYSTVVRIFSICKDFLYRQDILLGRGAISDIVGRQDIFHFQSRGDRKDSYMMETRVTNIIHAY